ncbi:hypothetical protein NIES2104_07890 [Leptolyngbya sp. NIES-2104]|nr:hypothetical protein NIES2104_07890 [Leptolyngbya sp. NIES-2104]
MRHLKIFRAAKEVVRLRKDNYLEVNKRHLWASSTAIRCD